ncbi:MAG: type II secretion system protein GspK [Candidatus Kaelpia aquatica]|nr:type II secretion system protein GspK [Candidatus Kaelpia aquatica]
MKMKLKKLSTYQPVKAFKKDGVISIFILWVIAVTVLMSAGISYRAYMELRSFRFYRERFYARNLIWRGFMQSLELLRLDYENNSGIDGLSEEWSKDNIEFQNEYGISQIRIEDEERKININQIAREENLDVLNNLFPPKLAQSIIDWVDEDSFQNYYYGGEQENYYNFLTYNCRNSNIRSLYEIKYIKGCPSDFNLKDLENQITTIGSEVNINTVSEVCLKKLELPDSLVSEILEFRQHNGVFNSIPDSDSISEIFPKIASADIVEQWNVLRNYFKVSSQYFRIYIIAQTERGVKRCAQALVQRKGSSFDILSWQENFWEK